MMLLGFFIFSRKNDLLQFRATLGSQIVQTVRRRTVESHRGKFPKDFNIMIPARNSCYKSVCSCASLYNGSQESQ